jgi:hypothetical protein
VSDSYLAQSDSQVSDNRCSSVRFISENYKCSAVRFRHVRHRCSPVGLKVSDNWCRCVCKMSDIYKYNSTRFRSVGHLLSVAETGLVCRRPMWLSQVQKCRAPTYIAKSHSEELFVIRLALNMHCWVIPSSLRCSVTQMLVYLECP